MIVSFDLDDTLIPGTKVFPVERQMLWQRLISRERIRAGSILLMHTLKRDGCRIFVYTTSLRSQLYIRCLFLSYGIWINRVINKTVHDKVTGEAGADASKLPVAFNIDLHVDDSPGVAMEGERFNFRTVIIGEKDKEWTQKILKAIKIMTNVK